MIDKICNIKLCTGCAACANVCPVQAISLKAGEIGHIFPVISDKCIDCKRCIKTCPANNPVKLQTPFATYAAWSKNFEEHSTSTSGGIAAELSNWVIDNGGVVYGCASLPHGVIEHHRCERKEELRLLKGSKYVQSHINLSIKAVISDLKNGRIVLFVGTPCQVAGLKNAVGDKDENLILVDLICHGVPSQQVLFKHLERNGFYQSEIDRIQFREKTGYYLSVTQNGKITYRKQEREDLYYMGFNENLMFRESCFICRYSNKLRAGDLTIGDFWGLGIEKPFIEKTEGNVSVILVNSEKGKRILNQCHEKVTLVERNLTEAIAGNHNLQNPSVCNRSIKFKRIYNGENVEYALKVCLRKRRLKCIIQRILIKLGLLK